MKKTLVMLAISLGFVFAIAVAGANAKNSNGKSAKNSSAQKAEMAAPAMPEIDKKSFDFVPEVVAVVGDRKITKEELVRVMTPQIRMMMMMGQKVAPDQYKELAKGLALELVKARILERLAADAGYKLTPELENQVYNKFLENIKKQMPQGKEFNFEELVKKQGLTIAEVKKQMAEGELIQTWIKEKVVPGITVSDADAKGFYDNNRDRYFKIPETVSASHILIKPKSDKPEDWKAAEDTAKKIYGEITSNKADFKVEAEKYSEGPSKKNGGDLGKFAKGQMVPEFEKACWDSAAKGKFPNFALVKTQFGWHVIKVTAFDKGGFVNYEDKLAAQIKQQLQQEKVAKQLQAMIDEQMKKINPTINLK